MLLALTCPFIREKTKLSSLYRITQLKRKKRIVQILFAEFRMCLLIQFQVLLNLGSLNHLEACHNWVLESLIQGVWWRAWGFGFITSSQEVLILLVLRPYFERDWSVLYKPVTSYIMCNEIFHLKVSKSVNLKLSILTLNEAYKKGKGKIGFFRVNMGWCFKLEIRKLMMP